MTNVAVDISAIVINKEIITEIIRFIVTKILNESAYLHRNEHCE